MKHSLKKSTVAFVLLLSFLFSCLFCLPSCQEKQEKYQTTYFDYFDTFSTLTVYAESRKLFEEYASLCEAMLEEYHQLLDIYHEYEGVVNLRTINTSNTQEELTIDKKLGEFLKFGKEAYLLTNGMTNIAMGSVLSLWHTARETSTLPKTEELLTANEHVKIDALILSEDHTKVQKNDPLLQLDAGALGKGFVAEKIKTALIENGCKSFLLNLGGNTVACGTKPNGDPWLVGIEQPTENIGFDGSVALSDASLVTSGSYQRYFTVDGVNYHHIIHPETLYPETYFLSVSVLCPDSAIADALSTALFCMSVEDGKALLKALENTEALWILEDGNIQTTDGFMNYVKGGKRQ